MKFNLKNYTNIVQTSFTKRIPKKLGESLNIIIQSANLNLLEIINNLNNSVLLNIESKEEIPIIFEDFNWFGKVKTKLNNFISKTTRQENLENSIAHYNSETKSIHIFNGIIEPKSNNSHFKETYNNLLNSVSNSNFIVNFFVLHEIGHAIHVAILHDKKHNNLTNYFKTEINNPIHKQQNTILHENFADMFAAIAYLHIDKDNLDLIKDLKLFSQFRKDITQEKYYTFNNLERIITDHKSNKLNFSNNEQILDYININTNNEIKIRLKENLQEILNSQQHNQYLSYLSHLFKLEDKSFNGIVSYLEKEINYIKPIGVLYENKYFNPDYKSSEINKIGQRIKKFTIGLDKSTNSNSLKNKI